MSRIECQGLFFCNRKWKSRLLVSIWWFWGILFVLSKPCIRESILLFHWNYINTFMEVDVYWGRFLLPGIRPQLFLLYVSISINIYILQKTHTFKFSGYLSKCNMWIHQLEFSKSIHFTTWLDNTTCNISFSQIC